MGLFKSIFSKVGDAVKWVGKTAIPAVIKGTTGVDVKEVFGKGESNTTAGEKSYEKPSVVAYGVQNGEIQTYDINQERAAARSSGMSTGWIIAGVALVLGLFGGRKLLR